MKPKVEVGPATERDFEDLSARSQHTPARPPLRVMAIAGRVDGRTIAIGGVMFHPNGVKHAFADIGDEARKYPIALHKAGLAIIELAKAQKVKQLVAVSDDLNEAAERWLLRLGFVPVRIGAEINYVLDLRKTA